MAQQTLSEVFTVTDRQWRGIGMIPQSGWTLSPRWAPFDAEIRFGVGHLQVEESTLCHSGEVLQGLMKPNECPAFGTACTPRTRWARPWSRPREPAPPTTSSAGLKRPPMRERPVTIDPADWVCPLPLRETKRIVLGHGGGVCCRRN